MKKHDSTILLGAHTSIAGGFTNAIKEGQELECTAIQIFTHSNRQWNIKPLDTQSIQDFKEAKKNSSIKSVIVHAGYLLNIAAEKEESRKQSLTTLTQELQRCQDLGITYLVLHPGSRLEQTPTQALARITDSLNQVLEAVPGSTTILLENMAGQGSSMGSSLQELSLMKQHVDQKKRIGFCFDTCHAFAAGYCINKKEGYEAFLSEFDELLGLEHLHAIHLNDSKKECGSRVDRHETIGKGAIGLDTFSWIMNDKRLDNVAKILETPYETDRLNDFAKNLAVLRSLID